MKRIYYISALIFMLVISGLITTISAQNDSIPPTIQLVSPKIDETIRETRPNVTITYSDSSGIDRASIRIIVDRIDVTNWEETTRTKTKTVYHTSELFSWKDGNHTVEFSVTDSHGNKATQTWKFIVDTRPISEEGPGIDIFGILRIIIIITIGIAIALTAYILYLKKTKGFTFEKFFAQHPIQSEVIVLYIPLILAFLFVIFSLSYVVNDSSISVFSTEYVIVLALFIALGPYAIDSQLEKRKKIKYERAFSQVLFEIADAMRGGLDPTKAIIEISKTNTGILKKQLKIASDNIKLGRPFNEIMNAIAKPVKSDLVKRYAALIGTTAKIGGEPAQVIHRAAKDMDDFIKVSQERRRQLTSQVTTIYIAFAVLLIILYQLILLFPSLGSIDISLLGATGLGSLEESTMNEGVQRMSFLTIKKRFFDLVLINSIGTGTIIGSFLDGHFKYGLLHSLILTLVSVLFFVILIL